MDRARPGGVYVGERQRPSLTPSHFPDSPCPPSCPHFVTSAPRRTLPPILPPQQVELLENMLDAVVVADFNAIIVSVNKAAERMFQRPRKEMIGSSVKILMPGAFSARHDRSAATALALLQCFERCVHVILITGADKHSTPPMRLPLISPPSPARINSYVDAYKKTNVKKLLGVTRELQGVRRDGETFPLEISLSEVGSTNVAEGSPFFCAILRDITERNKKYKTQASHYESDFKELELLGFGSFGSVYKCHNKLDGQLYAIKKIVLRTGLRRSTYDSVKTAEGKSVARKLKEVRLLARISTHRNIVRYYTSWVELVPIKSIHFDYLRQRKPLVVFGLGGVGWVGQRGEGVGGAKGLRGVLSCLTLSFSFLRPGCRL